MTFYLGLTLGILLGGGLFGLGIYLIKLGLALRAEAAEPESWPTVQGRRDKVSFEERLPQKWTQSIHYSVKIRYSYTVNGKHYRRSCIAIGYDGSYNEEAERGLFTKLQSATRVTVRYDPADPKRSCLTIGSHRQGTEYLFGGFFLLWFLLGFVTMVCLGTLSEGRLLQSLDVR